MAFQFAAVTNKEISQINKLFRKYTKKVTKFSLELIKLYLSVWLELIDEASEKIFCLQMQIKSCVALFSLHVLIFT